jgi:CBS domain-containing protein
VALEVFKENLFHALPVVEEGNLVGIITTYDIISRLADEPITLADYKDTSQ